MGSLRRKKDATDQPIEGFFEMADAAFRERLERFGFKPIEPAPVPQDRYFATRIYQNGTRYIDVYASTHYRDAPAETRVGLGEGSLEWPERDWNGIALWHLQAGKGQYCIPDVSELPGLLRQMADDLEEVAHDFLIGDTKRLRKVRAEITKKRKPYTIHTPDEKGRYHEHIEEESAELKRRFESATGEE